MFAYCYSKLSRTCYGESTPYALEKSSVLRWLQKQDDDDDEEKSRTVERPPVESSKLHYMHSFLIRIHFWSSLGYYEIRYLMPEGR